MARKWGSVDLFDLASQLWFHWNKPVISPIMGQTKTRIKMVTLAWSCFLVLN